MTQLSRTACVLVVDDTPDMRRYIASVLEGDFRVVTARDGVEGLDAARTLLPDLIISDVMMPRMSGDELCRAIKGSSGRLARTPVVLLTARAEHEGKLEGLTLGADDYLFKPFSADELRLRVRNFVQAHRYEQALFELHRTLDADLELARAFQQSLLPAPVDTLGPTRLAVHYAPAHAVGGDFYDMRLLTPTHARVLLADVTDHGVPAALRTITLKAEYETVCTQCAGGPKDALAMLNRLLLARYPKGSIRLAACLLDIKRELSGAIHVHYVSAGHEGLWAVSAAGAVRHFELPGLRLGHLPTFGCEEMKLALPPKTRLWLVSDGVLEQPCADGTRFDAHIEHALSRSAKASTPEKALESMLAEWSQARSRVPQRDDVTAMALEPFGY